MWVSSRHILIVGIMIIHSNHSEKTDEMGVAQAHSCCSGKPWQREYASDVVDTKHEQLGIIVALFSFDLVPASKRICPLPCSPEMAARITASLL